MSKKGKIIVACLLAWNYAMGPSERGVGDDVITHEQEEQMRKELRAKGE